MALRASAPSAAEQKAFTAEKNTALVRLAVIVFGVSVYWAAYYPRGIPWLAGAVSAVALAYALYDVFGQPYRHFPILLTSMWTAVTDAALITVWLHATGDIDSPFYLLWFLSIVAVAFRYDWRATAVACVLYLALYTGLVAATGGLPARWLDLTIRLGYLALLGALGSILARESARIFDERFALGQRVEEADRFRALAEASPQALIVHQGTRILDVNQAYLDLIGRSREAAIGQAPLDLLDAAGKARAARQLDVPSDEPFEVVAHLPQGHRVLRIQSRAVTFMGQAARVAAFADVTEERAAERERAKALQSEMEVQRLREMDRFKTEFINAAAHELNTPLTPIKLQLHVLRRSFRDAAPEQQAGFALLDRNLTRLSQLVEDMLDVARLESGRIRLDPKPCDVMRLAQETAETFREMAQEKGILLTVTGRGPLSAVADAKRVTQILYNLVSNALKFTPSGGHVTVAAQASPAVVTLAVQDTGFGMTPNEAGLLFHPFVQLHRDRVMVAGTGLGLYISRGLAERHGGALVCESPGPGFGSTFTLSLPPAGPPPGR
ncbi:MAG: HAMP domain-containing sensor histidine kinase [bacterium]